MTVSRTSIAAIGLVGLLASGPVFAEDQLTYFTWSGYELPDFEQGFPCRSILRGLRLQYFGDDDDAFTKVKAGFHPDVAHPCYDKVARWGKEDLLQPIDTQRIKNWSTDLPGLQETSRPFQAGDGKVWMVPWDWGNTSILYRTDLVKNPEAELEPSVGQAIFRPDGDHRRRPRHACGCGAPGRRQPVRHDRCRDGQGRGEVARTAARF